jgi:hypothetical protein
MERTKEFLMPGTQKSTGGSLLPAVGIGKFGPKIIVTQPNFQLITHSLP